MEDPHPKPSQAIPKAGNMQRVWHHSREALNEKWAEALHPLWPPCMGSLPFLRSHRNPATVHVLALLSQADWYTETTDRGSKDSLSKQETPIVANLHSPPFPLATKCAKYPSPCVCVTRLCMLQPMPHSKIALFAFGSPATFPMQSKVPLGIRSFGVQRPLRGRCLRSQCKCLARPVRSKMASNLCIWQLHSDEAGTLLGWKPL